MNKTEIKNVCRLLRIARANFAKLSACKSWDLCTRDQFYSEHGAACLAAEIINNCLDSIETVCAVPVYRAKLEKELDRLLIVSDEYITVLKH